LIDKTKRIQNNTKEDEIEKADMEQDWKKLKRIMRCLRRNLKKQDRIRKQ
jgi:hypothetical protein